MNDEGTKDLTRDEINENKTVKVLPAVKMILEIAGLLTTVFVVISYLSNLLYQIKCERFYKIKGDFFSTDIRPQIAYFVLSFGLLILFVYPAYARNIEKRNIERKEKKSVIIFYVFLSIVFGMMFGAVNLYGILKFPRVWRNLENDKFGLIVLIVVVLVCGIITIVGLTLAKEMSLLKRKRGAICYYVWFASAYLMLLIYMGQIAYTLMDTVDNKVDYEFILDAEKQYVVLDDVGDEVLVVEYSRDEELDEMIFYTKSYTFLPRNDYSYAYGYLNKPPIIKYWIKPEENNNDFLEEGE